jgi:hypothetical protein
LLDSKTPETQHLSIEKKQGTNSNTNQIINDLLFNGDKGYNWLTQFLGLMHTIRMKPGAKEMQKNSTKPEEMIMT